MKYIPLEELKKYIPPVETNSEIKPDYLTLLCSSIKEFEGFYEGSRSWKNNNPGNCRYSSVGYLPIYGEVKKDAQNFAIFKDYETGWLYLQNLIKHKATTHPDWNLISLMKEYAPSSDNNNPNNYASWIGKKLGKNPFTFTLKELLV